jgi:hypothetical protein
MRVIVLVKATKNSEAGLMQGEATEQMFREMGKYNEELVNAGIMKAGEGLHPSSRGKRIKFNGSKRTVIDGPFSETKELVAGFWIWEVKSMDEAVTWAQRCPNPMPNEEGVLEIREVFAPEAFAELDPTGEIRKQEEALRNRLEQKS